MNPTFYFTLIIVAIAASAGMTYVEHVRSRRFGKKKKKKVKIA